MNSKTIGLGKCIAVLTSGGDAQGMNAAIRGVVRMGLSLGAKVYAVRWGYQGLIDGGENIFELTWSSVENIIHLGGTFIGSARCSEFMTAQGRKKAALNLIQNKINGIVVIGGDGSLSGADQFRNEWPGYVQQLIDDGLVDKDSPYKKLNIVGIVGSIDNDFCGTDMTIGADSALHRIVECTESIRTTAKRFIFRVSCVLTALSHQRAFVLEVMGRNSGYLGLISGIASSADFIFIPEAPVGLNWKEDITQRLNDGRKNGKLYAIVIIAEGSTDILGNSISSDQVKDVIAKTNGFNARSTVLGHVQRGGTPSAYDRILATRFGVEAVISLFLSNESSPSYVVCLESGRIVVKPLMECVNKLQEIKKSYKEKRFDHVVSLRGSTFQKNMVMFRLIDQSQFKIDEPHGNKSIIGLVCVGAVAPGSTSLCRSITRSAIAKGDTVFAFEGGFPGLARGKCRELSWLCVEDWVGQAGNVLGTTKTTPENLFEDIAKSLKKYKIDSLVIVGGFEGMVSLKLLSDASQQYKEFSIPMVHVPVTMSNNIPGTYISVGADSSLNVACEAVDQLIQSGKGYTDRIYVVEVMGKKCGYLAVMIALATGANNVYIFEEKFHINDLVKYVESLKKKIEHESSKFSLILMSDEASENYNNKFVSSLINEEIPGVRAMPMTLGYIQQGRSPSPFDRFKSAKIGLRVSWYLHELMGKCKSGQKVPNEELYTVCVLDDGSFKLKHIKEIYDQADIKNRAPKTSSFLKYKQLVNLMSGLEFKYQSEAFPDFILENKL